MNGIVFEMRAQLPRQRALEILCTAREGGINRWVRDLRVLPDDVAPDEAVLTDSGCWVIRPVDEDRVYHLNRADIQRALRNIGDRRPGLFDRLMGGHYDAADADALVQTALFGEVVYG